MSSITTDAPIAAQTSASISPPKRRNLGLWSASALAALLLGTALLPALKTLEQSTPVTLRPVTTAPGSTPEMQGSKLGPASSGDVASGGRAVQAPGWLEPDPYAIAVTALADSVVKTVDVLEGQSVKKGQVVATLIDEDAQLALSIAEAGFASRQAHIVDAEADVAAAQDNWAHPIVQEKAVETSRAMLAMAKAQLAQLPAQIKQADANAERWRYELEQIDRALTQKAATEQEARITLERRRAAEGVLESIRLQEGVLNARVDELAAQVKAAERDLKLRIPDTQALARAKAKLAESQAAVLQAKAQRAEAKLRLDRMTIQAPIDGRVLRRLKMPGDKVMLGMDDPHSSHILHLYDPTKIQVRVDVPLADAALIRESQACEVIVDVLPDTVFKGVVTRITHEADLQKNTLQIKVRVINPSPMLRPEMLTRVKFLPTAHSKTQVNQALHTNQSAAPLAAVRISDTCIQNRSTVLAVRDRKRGQGVAETVNIRVISEEDGIATVQGDLQPGDWLIENPQDIQTGQRVRFINTQTQEAGAA